MNKAKVVIIVIAGVFALAFISAYPVAVLAVAAAAAAWWKKKQLEAAAVPLLLAAACALTFYCAVNLAGVGKAVMAHQPKPAVQINWAGWVTKDPLPDQANRAAR